MDTLRSYFNTIEKEKIAFSVLLVALLATALLYAYFVNQTVLNVVARKNIEENMTQTHARIGEMEFEYMKLKESLTIEKAFALGLEVNENKRFVSRSTSDTLTLRD